MALKVADYAYVLETGNLTMSGTGAQLLSDPQVKAAYLGKNGKNHPQKATPRKPEMACGALLF